MFKRLLHLVCMALNFLYADQVPIPCTLLLRRSNAAQLRLVAHAGRHLKAFGASVGDFAFVDSGRRNPHLIARLSELCSFVAATPAATRDTYADLSGNVVPTHNDAAPSLEPFRSLDVAGLRLSGRGHWDPSELLPDELRMAYLEPRALLHDVPPPDDFVPVWSREDPRETKALADRWDSLGLLVVRLGPPPLGFRKL